MNSNPNNCAQYWHPLKPIKDLNYIKAVDALYTIALEYGDSLYSEATKGGTTPRWEDAKASYEKTLGLLRLLARGNDITTRAMWPNIKAFIDRMVACLDGDKDIGELPAIVQEGVIMNNDYIAQAEAIVDEFKDSVTNIVHYIEDAKVLDDSTKELLKSLVVALTKSYLVGYHRTIERVCINKNIIPNKVDRDNARDIMRGVQIDPPKAEATNA